MVFMKHLGGCVFWGVGCAFRAVRILAGWGLHLGGVRIQGYTQLRGGGAQLGGGDPVVGAMQAPVHCVHCLASCSEAA